MPFAQPLPAAIRARAIERWMNGEPVVDIAHTVGRSVRTICYWTSGLTRRKYPCRHSDRTKAHAVRLYCDRGFNSNEVAEILGNGLRGWTVLTWVRQANREVRPPGVQPKSTCSLFQPESKEVRS